MDPMKKYEPQIVKVFAFYKQRSGEPHFGFGQREGSLTMTLNTDENTRIRVMFGVPIIVDKRSKAPRDFHKYIKFDKEELRFFDGLGEVQVAYPHRQLGQTIRDWWSMDDEL